jgi:hypothetical protein
LDGAHSRTECAGADRGRWSPAQLGENVEILISFNFEDVHLAEALRASLFLTQPDQQIVLSPASYGAVLFKENIAAGVYEADAFLVLVGPNGMSSWQEIEFGFALERHRAQRNFPLTGVLAGNGRVPGDLVSLGLNWINVPVVTDRKMLGRLLRDLTTDPPSRLRLAR